MRLQTGSCLGPYEITGPIGAGGMGEVYRARDTRLLREVAVKVLPHDLTRDAERLARFEREARSASALNHRNIVTVHDFGSLDGEKWLVMELIRGESLRDAIARGPLPLKKLLSIASGIADGLAAAHAAGIVHRDLKPENVMMTSDGTPKLLDFGLVKQVATTDPNSPTAVQMSQAGAVMGTASYMSPEQARGEEVDYRTDHFALGLILHEMAAGKHPFRRATSIETMAAILNEEPERLSDTLPEAFVAIVERCLAKNPEERYGSTADLAHDLRRLRDGRERSMVSRPRAPRAWWAVAGAVALAAIIIFSWMTWRGRTTAPGDPIHVAVATPEFAEVRLGGVAVPVALSPDGRYLVVRGVGVAGGTILSLHDLRTGTTRLLAENASGAGWSPDSKAVAYFADGKLKTATIDGSPPRIVCDALPEGTPSWHGGTILFTQYSREPGIYRVNSAGGTSQRLVSPRMQAWWPQFLPDGNHFLYLNFSTATGPEQSIRHELMLGSLDGSPARRVSADFDSRAVFVAGYLLFVRDGVLLAQPFDTDQARLTGDAKPIVDGLDYFRSTGGAAFTVSDNGLLVWCSARRTSRLAWIDRAGMEAGSVGVAPFVEDGRLSPDGNRYAVGIVDPKHGASDVWSYDLARGSAERHTFQLLDEKAPVWAPDGRTIYYRSDGGGGPPDIAEFHLGDERRAWVYRGPRVEEPQDVSKDGKWLLFSDYSSKGADLNVLPLKPPGPPRQLVATPFNELSPRFSPDGLWVAYQSDASGRPEVYVRMFEGTAETRRVSKDGGTRPRWGRDGRELFFLGQAGRLMAVAMSADGTPSTPRTLFQAAGALDFDVAPDGRFLVQLEERSADPTVHLLINWPARLRQP